MATVMLREEGDQIYFYIAKKDMEETIKTIEFNTPQKWGGEVLLSNDQTWWIEPGVKKLPKEAVCKKLSD
ncbi:MAG: putative nitrogen fixation protein NifT [Campylobacteraceae bacterium]|jgi:nitrogen fixation protein NifT|nr:putative nitrogen fixation protein NifT [Campylobacteraceae bacterium]